MSVTVAPATPQERILRIAEALGTLRESIEPKIRGKTVTEAARLLGLEWIQWDRFWNSKSSMCGATYLRAIAEAAERPDLYEAIREAAQGLTDRERGLTVLPPSSIQLVFDLRAAYEQVRQRMTMRQFATFFSPHEAAVEGALNGWREPLAALTPETGDFILTKILETEWATAAVPEKPSRPSGPKDELEELKAALAKLQGRYPSTRAMLDALKLHHQTYKRMLKRRQKDKDLPGRVLRKAKALLGEAPPAEPVRSPAAPKDLLARLEGMGGETSPLGVRFVLGPGSFREIEGDLERGFASQYAAFLKRQIELARLLMNVAAQVKDPDARREIREALGPEVEELELAIRAFSAEFPNRLTRLHEAQRNTWAGMARRRR